MSNDGTGLRERLLAAADKAMDSGYETADSRLLREAATALSAVAPPPVLEGSLTYAEQRKVVERMTTELGAAIEILRSVQQRAEAIDCQPLAARPAAPPPALEGWVLVPRDALRTEASRLRYRATETCGLGPETTDAGAQMVATAEALERYAASPASPEGGEALEMASILDGFARDIVAGVAPSESDAQFVRAVAAKLRAIASPAPAQQAVTDELVERVSEAVWPVAKSSMESRWSCAGGARQQFVRRLVRATLTFASNAAASAADAQEGE